MILALLLALTLQGGACDTVGFNNHNMGNLLKGSCPWRSSCGVDEGGRLKFRTDQEGLDAIRKVLRTYHCKYKVKTIERLCGRWCGPGADWNARKDWIRTVRQRTGTKPGAKLNFADPQTAMKIARGICWAENSCDDIPEQTYKFVFE